MVLNFKVTKSMKFGIDPVVWTLFKMLILVPSKIGG